MSKPTLELEKEEGFYVSVGELIAGKYRVERVLGSGGMAFVLSARHVELDQCFALKFLDERFLGNEKVTERFTLEARAASKLRSEHVARVYDVGTHNGAPFFVMEHLEGRDLAAVMFESGPLAVEDAVEYVMQVCEALAVAHSQGIVHRDIKPENLFLVEREGPPLVKVLDFGISKVPLASGEPARRLTGELNMGTPCYMSPEQIRSTASVDGRSDLWSLGVVLYELLAGREAFRADSVNAVCAAILELEPPPLSQLRSDVPEGLVDVIMKCLEKSPDQRFADVGVLAGALLPFGPDRALVSAERSSSVMRGARRASGMSNARISSVRPSAGAFARAPASSRTPASSRVPASSSAPPRSEAPLVHSVRPARDARFLRRTVMVASSVVAAALGVVTALHLLGAPASGSAGSSASSSSSSMADVASASPAEALPAPSAAPEGAIGLLTAPRVAAATATADAAAMPPPSPRAARTGTPAPAPAAPPAPAASIDLGY